MGVKDEASFVHQSVKRLNKTERRPNLGRNDKTL